MKQSEWFRIGVQVLVCAGILGLYLLRFNGAATIFFQLLLICIFAISISTLIEKKVRLNGIINSITANLLMAFVFFAIGNYLSSSLTLEIIESIKPDLAENNGLSGQSKVVTAAMIGFGGWELFFIYVFNAIFAYSKYLPEFGKKEDEPKMGNDVKKLTAASINKFSVKQGGKLYFVHYDQIHYIEASGNYINIFSGGKKYTLRESLQDWLSKTGKDHLLRVHRSFVINTNAIKELSTNSDGQYNVVLDSGDSVKVGKQYKASLFNFLGLT